MNKRFLIIIIVVVVIIINIIIIIIIIISCRSLYFETQLLMIAMLLRVDHQQSRATILKNERFELVTNNRTLKTSKESARDDNTNDAFETSSTSRIASAERFRWL
jgi:cell division protein FtsL